MMLMNYKHNQYKKHIIYYEIMKKNKKNIFKITNEKLLSQQWILRK